MLGNISSQTACVGNNLIIKMYIKTTHVHHGTWDQIFQAFRCPSRSNPPKIRSEPLISADTPFTLYLQQLRIIVRVLKLSSQFMFSTSLLLWGHFRGHGSHLFLDHRAMYYTSLVLTSTEILPS